MNDQLTDGSTAAAFGAQTSVRLLSQPPPPLAKDTVAAAEPAPLDENAGSARLDMDEITRKMAELERHPTQEEIDELMAQYEDYSDQSGEYSDDDDDDDPTAKEDVIMKILVVGNARCGKTSTIRRFVSGDFSDEYVSTIGADFVEKVVEYDDRLRLHLQLWDIAGQDRFAKLTRAYFREAKGALIVCDITRENTIDAVVTWKNELDLCCQDLNHGESIPVVMVANKSDLLNDPMGALNIGVNMQKCVTNNAIIEWFRASAKNGEHIDDAFQCLIDSMVDTHREHQRRAAATQRDSTSTASASDVGGRGPRHEDDDDEHKRDDIIRLSQFSAPSRLGRGQGGMCDCN